MVQVFFFVVSWTDVAVIVTAPFAFAVTSPVLLTVAILALPVDHVTAVFVMPVTDADSCTIESKGSGVVYIGRDTVGVRTVMEQVAFFVVSSTDVAVTVVFPPPVAVTRPDALTVATAALAVDHVTALFARSDGANVALNCLVVFISIVALAGDIVIPVGATTLTVMLAVMEDFTAEAALMVAVPAFLPETTPALLTEATAELLVVHFTLWEAADGVTFGFSFKVEFMSMVRLPGVMVRPVGSFQVTTTLGGQVACFLEPKVMAFWLSLAAFSMIP